MSGDPTEIRRLLQKKLNQEILETKAKKGEEIVFVEMKREIIWIFAVGINLSF